MKNVAVPTKIAQKKMRGKKFFIFFIGATFCKKTFASPSVYAASMGAH